MFALVLLAGCGGGSASDATDASPSTSTLTPAQQAPTDERDPYASLAPNPYREPGPTTPHTKPLRRLIVRDIKRGRGPAVTGRDAVYVNYVKTYWRSGEKFLTAWGPRRVDYLHLAGQAPGVRRGMIGMRPGGRRTIGIPGAISDVHNPDGGMDFVAAQIDIVLLKIVTE